MLNTCNVNNNPLRSSAKNLNELLASAKNHIFKEFNLIGIHLLHTALRINPIIINIYSFLINITELLHFFSLRFQIYVYAIIIIVINCIETVDDKCSGSS